jgi:hypothetical protein
MVDGFVGDSTNASTVRIYESRSATKTMEAMWLE